MKQLDKGKSYWVCELPTSTTNFLKPKLMILTDIIFDPTILIQGRNYDRTYKFGELEIPAFMDNELKCYMATIDNFIITSESAKIQMIIKNSINESMYPNGIIDEKLDIEMIKAYITEVNTNQPQLLI